MTPNIERFMTENPNLHTPYLVVDLDAVAARVARMQQVLPGAALFYAIKANPDFEILRTVHRLGGGFDCASLGEIVSCLEVGVPPEKISFGNTVKRPQHIAEAHRLGVRLFVFDCREELEKIACHAPNSQVFCRLVVHESEAAYPLGKKFGTRVDQAIPLLIQAHDLGLTPIGVSFHTGSQQTNPGDYVVALERTARVRQGLRDAGIEMTLVNAGGGFPASNVNGPGPKMEAFAEAIKKGLKDNDLEDLTLMLEPGRFLVADAGILKTEVLLVSRRNPARDHRWVYLDAGKFTGLVETEGEAIEYHMATPYPDDAAMGPVTIAGPSCDSADTLYEKVYLPQDLKIGDHLLLSGAGAYTTTYATVGFNGFAPLKQYLVDQNGFFEGKFGLA